jgi:UDPglucose 6-dehydrogenase
VENDLGDGFPEQCLLRSAVMDVCVIGTGYVGLTTGVCLAYVGHHVTCIDIDHRKIQLLNDGQLPIYEPGMGEVLARAGSRLRFTTSYQEAVANADVIFLAVGTPAQEDGSPNLSYLFAAMEAVLDSLTHKASPTILVNKSTVPVGTADQMMKRVHEAGLEYLVSIVSNPEFLRQGRAIHDTLYPDRIVVGGERQACLIMEELYKPLLQQSFNAPSETPRPAGLTGVPWISAGRRSAELAKYAANAFLAMKISFINEIANVSDRIGADVRDIARIIGADPRIGPSFLQAGIGYGGSCFPKDTRALHYIADTNGYDFKLLSSVIEVNRKQKFVMLDKLKDLIGDFVGKKIAVLGLTFKPGTDDLREAPSLPIIEALLAAGAEVYAHDPIASDRARIVLPTKVQWSTGIDDALRDADAALLITEWPEYLQLDTGWIRAMMRRPLWIDGRNASPEQYRSGLEYRGIGVGASESEDFGRQPSMCH